MLRAQDHKRAGKRITISENHGIVGREVGSLHIATKDRNRLERQWPQPRLAMRVCKELAQYPYFSGYSHLIGSGLLSEILWHL
jgi:hypothetical protein